jgi:hypothetical protein
MPKSQQVQTKSSKKGRGEATTNQQKLHIILWLEEPRNFDLITGNAVSNLSSVVAGAKLTKKCGYESLRDYVNHACSGTNWTWQIASARYKAYIKVYTEVARLIACDGGSKFCVGDETDRRLGIKTLAQKKEHLCAYFTRLDQLFGGRQNVFPSHSMEPEYYDYALPAPEDREDSSDSGEDREDSVDDDNEYDDDDDDEEEEDEANIAHQQNLEDWNEEQSVRYAESENYAMICLIL